MTTGAFDETVVDETFPVPFPFIVGCGRSGTTLLRAMLDTSPLLAIPPESHFITTLERVGPDGAFDPPAFVRDVLAHFRLQYWDIDADVLRRAVLDDPPSNYSDGVRRIYAAYATARGKARYADKTPGYAREISILALLFPEARFINLVRDARDVAPALTAAPWGPSGVGEATLFWQRTIERAWKAGRTLGADRFLEITYEQLVSEPEATLRTVCAFIDLPYDSAMLHPEEQADRMIAGFPTSHPHTSLRSPIKAGLRDWRRDLPVADVALIEALAGDTIAAAGYERRFATIPQRARARARVTRARRWLRIQRTLVRPRLNAIFRRS